MTSAPKSARYSDSMLPATRRDRSTTRTSLSGPCSPGSNAFISVDLRAGGLDDLRPQGGVFFQAARELLRIVVEGLHAQLGEFLLEVVAGQGLAGGLVERVDGGLGRVLGHIHGDPQL